MSEPMREAMTKALTENGISEGVDGLHGWRCAHPDIYGPCTCVAELLDDLAAALAPLIEARVREARAEALTEAAEAWTQGAWASTPRHKDRVAARRSMRATGSVSAPRRCVVAELDQEHVEAVARLLHDGNPNSGIPWGDKNDFHRSPYRVRARQILTSTDPDVHAALLAALVRAGYLRRAKELAEVAAELATASGCSPQDALKVMVQALTEVVSHAHE